MRFEPIRYLRWALEHLDARPPAYDLASSGVEKARAADVGLDPPVALPIAGDNSSGHPQLCALVAQRAGVAPERVLLAAGTSLANFLMLAATIGPGDVVLCERPVYEPLVRAIEALGAQVSLFARLPASGFAPDLAAIRAGLARGARLVVLTDLHNPSAALLDRALLREIGGLAERYGARVLVDEVYLAGVFDPPGPVESAARLGGPFIATASLTKIHGLGGLRAGWAIAPPEVVARAREVNDYLGVEAPFIADEAAVRAFERVPALLERARSRRAANWPIVRRFLEERALAFFEPAGAFMVWVRLPEGRDGSAFAAALRARYDTQVTPGAFFGVPDHIRIGYGGPTERVAEGLRRIALALEAGN